MDTDFLSDLLNSLSNSGISNADSLDVNDLIQSLTEHGVDLSMYTADEIMDALRTALSDGDVSDGDMTFSSGESHHSSMEPSSHQVTFEGSPNRYDENTAKFVKKASEYGFEIPRSVDHTASDKTVVMDRHSAGGMTSVDKSITINKINSDYNKGLITAAEKDELLRLVRRC